MVGVLHIYKIWNLVIRIAIFLDFLAVKDNGSDVNLGICLTTPQCFNKHKQAKILQTSHGLRISVYFHQIVPITL